MQEAQSQGTSHLAGYLRIVPEVQTDNLGLSSVTFWLRHAPIAGDDEKDAVTAMLENHHFSCPTNIILNSTMQEISLLNLVVHFTMTA